MKLQRKIIYLYSGEREEELKNTGFAKIHYRHGQLQIEIHYHTDKRLNGGKIYLLERDKHTINKSFFYAIHPGENTMRIQDRWEMQSETGELVGIMVEKDGELICWGCDHKEVHIQDYLPIRKSEDKRPDEIEDRLPEKIQMPKEIPEEEGEPIEVMLEEAHDEAYQYRKIMETRKAMYPFEDDEMEACVQIAPKDFSDFPKRFWHLGSNTFLLQGYYNYRHLILAETKEKMHVGIPGQFHRRDKYLADMFGFSRFKGIHNRQIHLGDFGYWIMEFEKPQPTEQYVEGCDEEKEMER